MAAKCASKTLFVGNLHASLEETDLLEIFRPYGRIVECCKRWCHYGFIQFATEEEARLAFNNLNGSRVRGRPMRIEFQRKKIRNLAALLEAEAQTKANTSLNGRDVMLTSGSSSDTENHSPSRSPLFFSNVSNDIFAPIHKLDNQLVSQFAAGCLSEVKFYSKSPLPLGNRSLNTLHQQQQQQQQNSIKKSQIVTQRTFSREIITNTQVNRTEANDTLNTSFDLDMTRFNYLLDRASKYPNSQSSSGSTSPTSSIHQKSVTHDSSIMVYRSLNTSNTIFVQPTDILEPLEIGEFNEYKLFPSNEEFYTSMSSPRHQTLLKHRNLNTKWSPNDLTPPSSVSVSSSSSATDSLNSPSPTTINRRLNIRRPLLN